jgi:hypothetical protein
MHIFQSKHHRLAPGAGYDPIGHCRQLPASHHSALLGPGVKGVVAMISHTIEQAHLIVG